MRGGAINYFPLPAGIDTAAKLDEQVSFYTVTAHGVLTKDVFLVPENTYILFEGPAGLPTARRANQIPESDEYRYIQRGETREQWMDRVFTQIRNKTFFQNFLYPEDKPFLPGSRAIYEPGDVIQDMHLSLRNDTFPFMLVGVWDTPIPFEIGHDFNQANQQLKREIETIELKMKNKKITQRDYQIDVARAKKQYDTTEQQFIRHPKNKYRDIFETSLFDILNGKHIKSTREKPIRFIFIEACRGPSDVPPIAWDFFVGNNYNEPVYKNEEELVRTFKPEIMRRRRLSLNTRRHTSMCVTSILVYNRQNLEYLSRTNPTDAKLARLVHDLGGERRVGIDNFTEVMDKYREKTRNYTQRRRNVTMALAALPTKKRSLGSKSVVTVPALKKKGVILLPIIEEDDLIFTVILEDGTYLKAPSAQIEPANRTSDDVAKFLATMEATYPINEVIQQLKSAQPPVNLDFERNAIAYQAAVTGGGAAAAGGGGGAAAAGGGGGGVKRIAPRGAILLDANMVYECGREGCGKQNRPDGQPLDLCMGCRRIRYCSQMCQVADWRARHKIECQRWREEAKEKDGGGAAAAGGGGGAKPLGGGRKTRRANRKTMRRRK